MNQYLNGNLSFLRLPILITRYSVFFCVLEIPHFKGSLRSATDKRAALFSAGNLGCSKSTGNPQNSGFEVEDPAGEEKQNKEATIRGNNNKRTRMNWQHLLSVAV